MAQSTTVAPPVSTDEKLDQFIKKIRNPVFFRLFLLGNLPLALFAGLKIKFLDKQTCSVSVPYNRITTNPFRSTYFAALSMAAEMSAGVMAMMAVKAAPGPVSMLVVSVEGRFMKKATGRTIFTFHDGKEIIAAVKYAVDSGEPVTFKSVSKGLSEAGDEVAEFVVTWSFKKKTR